MPQNQEYPKDLIKMIVGLSKRRERNNLDNKNTMSTTMPENGPIKLQALFQRPQKVANFSRPGSISPRYKSTTKPRVCRTHENSVNFDPNTSSNDYNLGDSKMMDYDYGPIHENTQPGKLSSTVAYR